MIIICEICGQYICPACCPEFNGYVPGLGKSTGLCELCGSRVYDGDGHHIVNAKVICGDCAEEIVSPDLLELFECADINDFFQMLQ